MVPKEDAWTIVLVGFWNRMIFMPEWVGNNLFGAEEIEKLVPLASVAPLIYRDASVTLVVEEGRLVVGLRQPTEECLRKAETVALAALAKLPETPVSACGVNFGFIEQNPDAKLLDVLNAKDDDSIGAEWEITTRKLIRQLTSDDKTMNFTLADEEGAVHLDANFNHEVASATDAAKVIESKVAELHGMFLAFLEDTYNLQLEEA